MQPDRSSIEHIDFSVVRRGYDPAEVRQRLGEIADAVEALQVAERSSQLSNEAAEQVRRIAEVASEQLRVVVEAAELSAADIRQKAEAEATRIVDEALRRAAETDESAGDVRQRAEADATRIVDEALERAAETDEWAELQAVGLRQAVAAAEALADRMGAGASAIGPTSRRLPGSWKPARRDPVSTPRRRLAMSPGLAWPYRRRRAQALAQPRRAIGPRGGTRRWRGKGA